MNRSELIQLAFAGGSMAVAKTTSAALDAASGAAWHDRSVAELQAAMQSGKLTVRALTAAGYPHVTVPAGFVHGLPVGVSFVGAPWSEAALIKLAYAYEQATRKRRSPKFARTIAWPEGA